jgi:hypothetical protein
VEETNETNKEMVARLRNQLKETEEELYAIHQIKEKKEEAKEKERSEASNLAQSDIGFSEVTATNSNQFKETLKGIREYLATIQSRKTDMRKMLLKA